MYGWRGRIGIILPSDNSVLEPEFYRLAPDGVTSHIVRLNEYPREEMPAKALELVPALVSTRVNVVGYMCAASSFMLGPKGNEEFCAKLDKASNGLPSFTATTAMTAALAAVGTKRVCVLAPHPPKIAQYLQSYLEDAGFTITKFQALGLELADINDTTPEQIYRISRRLDLGQADALFIAATNFAALQVIEQLEADLGRPVITSNQAAMWMALKTLGVRERQSGFGRLLREMG